MDEKHSKILKGSKLRNRFLVLFVVLATVPILVLGAVSLYLVDLAHRQDVSALELQLIDQKTEEIDEFLARNAPVEVLLEVEGRNEAGIVEYDPAGQAFLLRGILLSNPAIIEVKLANLAGIVTSKMVRQGGQIIDKYFPENISSHAGFDIARKGETYIGEVYYENSVPYITFVVPLRERDKDSGRPGETIFVMFAEADISELARSIERAGVGNSGYLILADSNKKLIASGGGIKFKTGDDLAGTERIGKVLSGKNFNGLGEEDRYVSAFSGAEVVSAAKKVPSTGWVLMAEWPISDADAIINDIRLRVIQFTAFSIIAVLIIAVFFAARLVRPIKKLQTAAEEIEQGKFETRVDIHTEDELEDLGQTFNKMAEGLKRLQELKDEFVFVAAHELRTPVTAIKGYLSLILEGSAGQISAQAKKFLEQTQRSNDRLNQLVNDLLEIARSEAGRLEIKVEPVDIEEPIKSTQDELKPLADEKKISISTALLDVMPKVMADSGRVKEVMVNLVGNSIKYTQEGGKIEILSEQKDGMLITHVRDNGFGMSKEAQTKLFEKFYRVQTDKTKNIQGTGLGLFIVKQIIEKMGGKIWVNSEEGKGSVFSFSLPLAGSYEGGDVESVK